MARVGDLSKDTVMVESHGELSLDFVADNPGDWLFHCHGRLPYGDRHGPCALFVRTDGRLRKLVRISREDFNAQLRLAGDGSDSIAHYRGVATGGSSGCLAGRPQAFLPSRSRVGCPAYGRRLVPSPPPAPRQRRLSDVKEITTVFPTPRAAASLAFLGQSISCSSIWSTNPSSLRASGDSG